jgi:hypothetical protein
VFSPQTYQDIAKPKSPPHCKSVAVNAKRSLWVPVLSQFIDEVPGKVLSFPALGWRDLKCFPTVIKI